MKKLSAQGEWVVCPGIETGYYVGKVITRPNKIYWIWADGPVIRDISKRYTYSYSYS